MMSWESADARTWVMQLAERGTDWVEVRRSDTAAGASWGVDSRLNGNHYKLREAFATKEVAQGCALLLAMRQLPTRRDALHAQLDVVPGAWWWKIVPSDETGAENRSVFSSRTVDSAEAAERAGRAAGAGWWLYVYGPGCVRAFGQLPR